MTHKWHLKTLYQAKEDENFVELNDGDGCKTMNIKKKAS